MTKPPLGSHGNLYLQYGSQARLCHHILSLHSRSMGYKFAKFALVLYRLALLCATCPISVLSGQKKSGVVGRETVTATSTLSWEAIHLLDMESSFKLIDICLDIIGVATVVFE